MALTIATWNLRGLHGAGYSPWPDFPAYTPSEAEGKITFAAELLERLKPDVVGIQEASQEDSFGALQATLPRFPHSALGPPGSGSGLRVGVLSAFPVLETKVFEEIPEAGRIQLAPDEAPLKTRFRRPILACRLQAPGEVLTVVVVHLKAKRPDIFPDLEDPSEPVVRARAMGRSLVVRAAEAAGLRALLDQLRQRGGPVALVGDFNDGLDTVSSRMLACSVAESSAAPREDFFYNTHDLHRARRPLRGLSYTHVWEDRPEILDHIVVSGDLARRFRWQRVLNDFLADADRDPRLTDHGLLMARFQGG